MTVLIGVLCQDGVVIGSDSSSTFSAGSFRTIEQPTQKIFTVADRVIIAGTGAVGLGQRFHDIVSTSYKHQLFQKNQHEIITTISRNTILDFVNTQAPKGNFGALMAFHAENNFHLVEYDIDHFQPELKTNKIFFVSMGSGQPITDPFMAFIRKIFWGIEKPTLVDGLFAVRWALEHAIELNPGGINAPCQLATLTLKDNKPFAKILDDAETSEQGDMITAAETHFSSFKDKIRNPNLCKIPDLPPS